MQENITNPTIQNQTNISASSPNQKTKSAKRIFLLTLFIIFIINLSLAFFLWSNRNKSNTQNDSIAQLPNDLLPTPTPIPFYEMTIPYLREREYKSNLGNLETNYQNSNYTAYLTNYNSDGFRVNGLLTKPSGEMPQGGWPAIVFVHGYIPPDQYDTVENYYFMTDYLAKNGFVVFKIDLRGHGNSEGEPGGGYYSSDYIIDVLNAYSALQSSDFVNPDKIGLWGHSMAGNVILRSLAAKPKIPGIVIWAGAVYTYSDFQEFGIDDNSYRPPQMSSERVRKRQLLFDTHGQFNEESPFWKQVAATNYLGDIKGAIQIHHATNDDVVDIRYSRNLNDILNQTSIAHELFEYPSGGHNITGSSFTQAMQRTVDFFRENLK